MRLKITRTQLAGQTEWTFDIDHDRPSRRDVERWSIEGEQRFRAALIAIAENPDCARDIAERILED